MTVSPNCPKLAVFLCWTLNCDLTVREKKERGKNKNIERTRENEEERGREEGEAGEKGKRERKRKGHHLFKKSMTVSWPSTPGPPHLGTYSFFVLMI